MDSNLFIRSSNIWGRKVLSFLGPKIVLFYEIIGGAFNAPPAMKRIFLTPPLIGLMAKVMASLQVATCFLSVCTNTCLIALHINVCLVWRPAVLYRLRRQRHWAISQRKFHLSPPRETIQKYLHHFLRDSSQ